MTEDRDIHHEEGLPEIDDQSPMFEILRHAMSLTEALISESHKANSEGKTPSEDERREWLETARIVLASMIIAKSSIRRWNSHILSPERT